MICKIREWKIADAANLAAALSNKKVQDNLRDGLPYPYTEQDGIDFISAMLSADKNDTFSFAVTIDDKAVGSIGVFRQSNIHRLTAELGYYIAEEYWGKGIMTEAVKQICEYVFANSDIIRIYAEPFAYNTTSCRVLEKSGFQYEGMLRKNAVKNGKVLDMKMYSLLKKRNKIIIKLKYGNTNTYFVRGENGGLLIDTDYAGTMQAFYKALKKSGISITDITYVLATHYHPDHIGLVSELQKMGIKLLLIDTQCDYVHFADTIFEREKHLRYEPIGEKNTTIIGCDESRDFLADLGIAGEIIQTASHSEDSISVVLDSGECMVGDLEPIEYLVAYEENIALQNDWKLVMSYHPKVIYYAHANEKHFV